MPKRACSKTTQFGPETGPKMAFHRPVTGRSFGVFSFVFNKTFYPRVGVRRKGEFPQAQEPARSFAPAKLHTNRCKPTRRKGVEPCIFSKKTICSNRRELPASR